MNLRAITQTSAFILLTSLFALGCDNDPAEGKTKVEAAAPVEQKAQETSAKSTQLDLSEKNGTVGFVGAKVTDKHEGAFEKFSGNIELSSEGIEKSKVELSVDVASMSIDPPKLKKHLLGPDFFDADKHPKASFSSTKIEEKAHDGATHEVTGNLELRGTKKSITFPATIKKEGDSLSVAAEFAINRKDFGIVYPGMPDDLIKDDVLIKLKLNAKK